MKRFSIKLIVCLAALSLAACGQAGEAAPPAEEGPGETPAVLLPAETPEPTPEPTPDPAPELSAPEPYEPEDSELVCVTDYLPDLFVELRYATDDNFTGQAIYDFSDAWLRYGTVKKLQTARGILEESGYSLKIWDAYRPAEAQFSLWEAMPDARFVANPEFGYSTHSSGGTVDLTVVSRDGSPLELPSDFDEFSLRADRDYRDVSETAARNAQILEQAMQAAGFVPYAGEWWHFADADAYPYEDLEQLRFPLDRQAVFEPLCEEYISLRAAPAYDAEVLARIPRGSVFCVAGWAGDFARIPFQGQWGYVAADYIQLKNGD